MQTAIRYDEPRLVYEDISPVSNGRHIYRRGACDGTAGYMTVFSDAVDAL